jgi:WS/DGAT/MGAT family acyltransferase
VAELAVQPLDRQRPLWQMHVIEDYQGGTALVFRIHHCIADGIALISVTQALVDGGNAPPSRKKRPRSDDPVEAAQDWLEHSFINPLTKVAVKALGAAGEGAAKSLGVLGDPQKGVQAGIEGGLDLARGGMRLAQDLGAMLLMPDDSPTRLKGTPGSTKKVAWCPPISLAEAKVVSKALNASLNDVLLSCVAGAISNYLQAHGDEVKGKEIRAMVPVNLRPLEEAWKLGNQFGLAPVVLPIGIANPVERVYEVRRRMAELKGSMQPLLAFATLAVAGLMIKPAQDALLGLFTKKTTAVMTNVPGPREKLRFCGATLEESLFWVPQSGSVGMGVSILSYGGGVQFGLITDAGLCPDPQAIIDGFAPEFAHLQAMVRMFD